jgi:hypothetical protein
LYRISGDMRQITDNLYRGISRDLLQITDKLYRGISRDLLQITDTLYKLQGDKQGPAANH